MQNGQNIIIIHKPKSNPNILLGVYYYLCTFMSLGIWSIANTHHSAVTDFFKNFYRLICDACCTYNNMSSVNTIIFR